MRSKLLPSGCKSIYVGWELHSSDKGIVRKRPWSNVIPVIRAFVGGFVVVIVTTSSLVSGPE